MKRICALSIVILVMFHGTLCVSEESQVPTDLNNEIFGNLKDELTTASENTEGPQSTSSLLKLALLNELVKQEVNCTHPCTKFMTAAQEEKLRSILIQNIGHPIKDPTVSNEVLLMCALTREFGKDEKKPENDNMALLRKVIEQGIKKKLNNGDINHDIKDGLIEALARDIKKFKLPQSDPANKLGDLGISLLGELKVIIQNQTVIVNNSAPVGNIYLDQNTVMQDIGSGGQGAVQGAPPGATNIATDQRARIDGADGGVPVCGPYEHLYRDDCAPSCAPWDLDCQMSQSRARFQHKLSKKIVKQINDVYETFTGSMFGDDEDNDDDDDEDDEETFRFRSLLDQMEEDSMEDSSRENILSTRSAVSGPLPVPVVSGPISKMNKAPPPLPPLLVPQQDPQPYSQIINQVQTSVHGSGGNTQNISGPLLNAVAGIIPDAVENTVEVINSDGQTKTAAPRAGATYSNDEYNHICESL